MMSTIRVAVIGCGYWGRNLIRNFADMPDVEVTAVCDFNLNALARVKRIYSGVRLTHSHQEILADPTIDAVAIATPVSTHYPFGLQALRAGKDVLVEKPLTASSQQAFDLIEVAEKMKRVLMVDHTFVYSGAIRRMRSIIESGDMGELLYFDSVRTSLGLVQSDINVIWDLAPHDFSILDYLCSEKPVAISTKGAKHLCCSFENMAYVTAHFQSKMIAHFHLNWLAPVKIRKTLVGGTQKMIVYDDLETAEKVRVYDNAVTLHDDGGANTRSCASYRNGDMVAPNLDSSEALRLVTREFVDCVRNQHVPISDGHAGHRVVRLLEAAQRSMELNGEPVELEPSKSPCQRVGPAFAMASV
jgi:predicted dehydrogenase